MSQSQPVGTPSGSSGLAALPAAWVGVVILWSIYGIWQSLPLISGYEIPGRILYFIYAGLAVDVVNILWGLYLLGLAVGRSTRFPRRFVVWQVANIAWAVLRQAYALMVPDFIVSVMLLVLTAGEIAVGVFLIQLLTRNPAAASAYASDGTRRPSVIIVIIAAILGVIVGGAVGFGTGLGGGVAFSEFTNMSCFEGACGYFAFFIGLFGLIIGAVAGGILAAWLTVRRRKPAAAASPVSN